MFDYVYLLYFIPLFAFTGSHSLYKTGWYNFLISRFELLFYSFSLFILSVVFLFHCLHYRGCGSQFILFFSRYLLPTFLGGTESRVISQIIEFILFIFFHHLYLLFYSIVYLTGVVPL